MAKPWYTQHPIEKSLRQVVDSHNRDLRASLRTMARRATWGKAANAIRQLERGNEDGRSTSDMATYIVYKVCKILLRDADSLNQSASTLKPHGVLGKLSVEISRAGSIDASVKSWALVLPVIDVLRVGLARTAIGRVDQAAVRATRLLGTLADMPLSPRATAYLHRVAQCYIWGFDTEAIMLARTVLDSALEERVPSQRVLEALEKSPGSFPLARAENLRKRYPPNLGDRIIAGRVLGFFSPDVAKMATDVRIRGNDAVHKNLRSDSFDTIQKLIAVLNAVP